MSYILYAVLTFASLMVYIEIGAMVRPDLFPEKDRKEHIVAAIFAGVVYPFTWFLLILIAMRVTYVKVLQPMYKMLKGEL